MLTVLIMDPLQEYYFNYSYYGGSYDSYFNWETESTPEDLAAQNINLYLPPIHLFLGTTGNVFSFIVLAKLTSKVLTTNMYLACLAVLDLLMILIRCINVWLAEIANFEITRKITNRSHAACQVYSFCSHLIIHLDAWMLALVVLESAILYNNPLKAHHYCSKDRVRNIMLLAILILVCINAHFFWTYGLEPDYMDNTKVFCTFSTFGSHYSEYFRKIVWPILDLLASAVGPGCVILGSCLHVFRRCCKQHPRVNMAEPDDGASFSILENSYLLDASATQHFVIVCMTLGTCSLVFNLPQTAYLTFEFVLERADLYAHFSETNFNFIPQTRLAGVVCESVKDLFLSFKFVIYVSIWPRFRKELVALFKRKKRFQVHHANSRNNCLDHQKCTDLCEDSNAMIT